MNPFASFFFGPYGHAFSVMDEYQFLPSPENFTEFSEEMYEVYFCKMGMPAERMYQLKPGSHYNEKEILTVSKTEMRELVKARAFVDKVTLDVPELEGASDLDRLNYFKAKFDFLFTDKNTEEK